MGEFFLSISVMTLFALLAVACGVVFFLPTIIAYRRKHNNFIPILLTNVVGGLCFGIGWCIALIWSLTDNVSYV